MIYYHGSDKKFDRFDLSYTKTGIMYATPCKLLSQSYAVGRTGEGYIYHIEISSDEHLAWDAAETDCGCKAYTSLEHWNIIKVEPSVHYTDMRPVFLAECGRAVAIPTSANTAHYRKQMAKRNSQDWFNPTTCMSKTDANGKPLSIGDKVHPLGKGSRVLYIIELNENSAGVSGDKDSTSSFGLNYDKIVKFKNQ